MDSTDKLESRSDAELLRLSLAGEENAFLLFYDRQKRGIFRYAFYMTNSKTIAEEVTQEVFICLLREGASYDEKRGDVSGFTFGIARNLVRRIGRRERVFEPLPDQEALEKLSGYLISRSETTPEQIIRSETVETVQAAIASLPDHYRQVVVLCDLCEFSYAEAASRLECAVGTVRSRLNRAHTLLAQKLKPLKNTQRVGAAGTEGCLI